MRWGGCNGEGPAEHSDRATMLPVLKKCLYARVDPYLTLTLSPRGGGEGMGRRNGLDGSI